MSESCDGEDDDDDGKGDYIFHFNSLWAKLLKCEWVWSGRLVQVWCDSEHICIADYFIFGVLKIIVFKFYLKKDKLPSSISGLIKMFVFYKCPLYFLDGGEIGNKPLGLPG